MWIVEKIPTDLLMINIQKIKNISFVKCGSASIHCTIIQNSEVQLYALMCSVMTPYYSEETVYSKGDLEMENEDGVSIIYYLQKIYPGFILLSTTWRRTFFQYDVPLPISLVYFLVYLTSLYFLLDEWNNFMERLGCKKESEVWENDENILQLRHWASLRGQTLCRTGTFKDFFLSHSFWLNSFLLIVYRYCIFFSVRGMMYYRRALKLQAFLDMASEGGKP